MDRQKTVLRKICWWFICFKKVVLHKDSYLHTSGWIESVKHGFPLSAEGEAIPWMNYPTIALLEKRLNASQHLFEFGSGFSTRFFAKRVASVRSVEYDQSWYQKISQNLPENADVIFKEKDVDGDYCRSIVVSDSRYDVVIVDGRDRVNCVKQSLDCLSDEGIVILDDAERDYYQPAVTYAREKGFRALTFEGLKPNKIRLSKSVILYRDGNCFGI